MTEQPVIWTTPRLVTISSMSDAEGGQDRFMMETSCGFDQFYSPSPAG